MRILTSVLILAPAGGIELCTLQDGAELIRRGHDVGAQYQIEGSQRGAYETAGIGLVGPLRLGLDRKNPVRSLRSFLRFGRLARRSRPDVVWLNRPEHIVWAQVMAWSCRVPIVGHLHNSPKPGRPRLINRFLFRGVTKFLAVSEFTRSQWIEQGLPADKVSVLHNAIPFEQYPLAGPAEQRDARDRLGLPQDRLIALFYGRIGAAKGVPDLLAAWRLLDRDDAVLIIVGRRDAEYEAEFERTLATLPKGSYRLFPEQADVVPFLHAADIVVVPTPQHEAFGRAVLEALMTGRPAIGTSVGGIPEVLSGPLERLVVPPASPEALAARIAGVLTWQSDEPGLGELCRSLAVERFPYDEHVHSLEEHLVSSVPPVRGKG